MEQNPTPSTPTPTTPTDTQPAEKTYSEAEYTALQAQVTTLQEQLTSARDTLKSFEGVDVQELRQQVSQLTADLSAKEQAYQEQLADLAFRSVLEKAVAASGARNATAVLALLDLEALKASKNQSEDIRKALEQVKQENDFLFASAEPIKNAVRDTGTPAADGITKEAFAKMGYRARLALKQSDPATYEALNNALKNS